MKEINEIENAKEKQSWKNTDERYLRELQKLYDLIENIENEKLRKNIIAQVIKFDDTLSKIAEEKLTK